MPATQHLGPFFGDDTDDVKADLLAIEHIDEKWLNKERPLLESRWFDYYTLHPTVATYYFAKCYRTAYQHLMAKRYDYQRAKYMRGFKGHDIFELSKTELTGFWKARQSADALGVPYDFYTMAVMLYMDKNLWRRAPRPTQIYNKAFVEHVQEQWEEATRAKIILPAHEDYTLENYRGERHQMDFHEWLVDWVNKRGATAYFALNTVKEYLPKIVITTEFSNAIVQRAYALD